MRLRAALPLVLVLALLTGCGTGGTVSETPAPTPTPPRATAVTPAPTAAPAPTETPAPKETPALTPTPAPTETPALTPTPAPTETPAPTPTLAPTEPPAPTPTPAPTEPPAPTPTPAPTEPPAPTEAPTPTEEPVPVEEPVPTEEPVPVEEPVPTEAPIPVEEPTPVEEPVPMEEPVPAEEPVPVEEPAVVPSVRLGETVDAGREYLDKLIFLGDSTTYGIAYYYDHGYKELASSSQVWTPKSGTMTLSFYATATIVYPPTGEELFIAEATARAQPEYLVITLGVNGIAFMGHDWFVSDYTALVESIHAASPNTKIILNSIYPIAASYKRQGDINNDKIRTANGWIEQIAADTGCRFLNSFESLIGENGYMPESRQNGDGLHLTGEALTIVMQYIRTHAWL